MNFGLRLIIIGLHSGGKCHLRNRELEMKSLLSIVSPNFESSKRSEEQIIKEREIVTTPAFGNVFNHKYVWSVH